MDHETFDVRGRWEIDRGPQHWPTTSGGTSGYDTMVTSDVGHAQHGEGRREPGAAAGRQVRAHAARLGPAPAAPPAGARSGRRAADGRSSCARRTTRRRPTASSAWWSRSRISPRRSGCGIARAAERIERQVGDQEGDRDSRRARRSGEAAAAAAGLQGGARRSSPTSTCRSTTASSTSPAGARASSSSTTSAIRSSRRRSAPSSSAASSAARRTRASRSSR